MDAAVSCGAVEVAGGISYQSAVVGKCSVSSKLTEAMKNVLLARRIDFEYRPRCESSIVIRRAVEIGLCVEDHACVRIDPAWAGPELMQQTESLRWRG